jgi:phosphatidylserine/phosphatidylglycerophosphate/cardiolipin synthase-like enzyme
LFVGSVNIDKRSFPINDESDVLDRQFAVKLIQSFGADKSKPAFGSARLQRAIDSASSPLKGTFSELAAQRDSYRSKPRKQRNNDF